MLLSAAVMVAVGMPLGIGLLHAQAPSAAPVGESERLTFEAASVKQNTSSDARPAMQFPPGRFVAINALLKPMIAAAYGFPIFRVTGGPAWLESTRFDIQAKASGPVPTTPGPPSPEVFRMLRTLLEDDFKLRVREVTQEQSIYRLVLARSDRRLGVRLRASTLDCEGLKTQGVSGPTSAPPPGEMPVTCGMWGVPNRLSAGAIPMAQLVGLLSSRVGRFVVDDTGLDGVFDLNLEYTPEPAGPMPAPADQAPPAGDVPSIFTALQEQLGLKLEGGRGPVPVLLVESAEMPAAR
jgi:uncharacterized protein (TIGR03435 family)